MVPYQPPPVWQDVISPVTTEAKYCHIWYFSGATQAEPSGGR